MTKRPDPRWRIATREEYKDVILNRGAYDKPVLGHQLAVLETYSAGGRYIASALYEQYHRGVPAVATYRIVDEDLSPL